MTVLFFDTETTGFPNRKLDVSDPSQPNIVQLAAIMTDDNGHELSSLNVIIRLPDKTMTVPDDVSKIHGITTDIMLRYGVRPLTAAALFHDMMVCSNLIVAHNISFDLAMLKILYNKLNKPQWMIERDHHCTMKQATPVVNLPPTEAMKASGRNNPKAPKLSECTKFFFDEELHGAHDALVDVRACARIYWHMKKLEASKS